MVADDAMPDVGGVSFSDFKAKVLERQMKNAVRMGRAYCANVPDSELGTIEGRHRMRSEAALKCRELLKAAREELDAKKAEGDALAKATKNIEVYSAYRNIAEDTAAWNQSFFQYYYETKAKREALPDGAHGRKALAIMTNMLISFKAAPGYSNHSNGLAVDFSTVHHGKLLRARKAQRDAWRETWLHTWLSEHAETYHFYPLDTEEWHWNYR
jgi:hypothetical protein